MFSTIFIFFQSILFFVTHYLHSLLNLLESFLSLWMSILVRMKLFHNGPVVLLGIALLLHALKHKIHRRLQKLVNEIDLFKTALGSIGMHLNIFLSQIARSLIYLTFLVLKPLLLLVHVLSHVLRGFIEELLLSVCHKTNVFLLIFVSNLPLVLALSTFAIQTAKRAGI